MIAHNQTFTTLDEQKDATSHTEKVIAELCEAKLKQKEWYEEQMLAENNLAEEIQLRIQNEMAWMEDMHTKEMDIL